MKGKELSRNTSTYTGRISLPAKYGANTTMTTMLAGTGTIAHSSIGNVAGNFGTDKINTLPEWTAWSALYQEYRILGIKFQYEPYSTPSYPDTTITPSLGVIAQYHEDGLEVYGSLAAAMENPSAKPWSTGKPVSMEWRMDGLGESSFLPTNTVTNFGGITTYTSGGTTSEEMGRYYLRYLVQFKGRK